MLSFKASFLILGFASNGNISTLKDNIIPRHQNFSGQKNGLFWPRHEITILYIRAKKTVFLPGYAGNRELFLPGKCQCATMGKDTFLPAYAGRNILRFLTYSKRRSYLPAYAGRNRIFPIWVFT